MPENLGTILIYAIEVKMKNKKFILALALAAGLVLLSNCGIKGPPLPPIETIESETINGKAIQSTSVSTTTEVKPVSSDKTKTKK